MTHQLPPGPAPRDGVVRALLFDLDGTLVDTRDANRLAYQQAMREAGHPITDAQFEGTWGRDARDFIPDLVPGIAAADVAAIRARKASVYGEHLASSRPNAALIGWLRALGAGHRTALVTTAKAVNARQALRAHGLDGLFDVHVFGDDVRRGKPDPEAYLRALELLDVPAAAALAFEDSGTGERAALAAGLLVLRVPPF